MECNNGLLSISCVARCIALVQKFHFHLDLGVSSTLKLQAALPRCLRHRLDASVVQETTTVVRNLRNPLLLARLGNLLAHLLQGIEPKRENVVRHQTTRRDTNQDEDKIETPPHHPLRNCESITNVFLHHNA